MWCTKWSACLPLNGAHRQRVNGCWTTRNRRDRPLWRECSSPSRVSFLDETSRPRRVCSLRRVSPVRTACSTRLTNFESRQRRFFPWLHVGLYAHDAPQRRCRLRAHLSILAQRSRGEDLEDGSPSARSGTGVARRAELVVDHLGRRRRQGCEGGDCFRGVGRVLLASIGARCVFSFLEGGKS